MDIAEFVKAKVAAGDPTLKSTYRHSVTGEEFEMLHSSLEHKRRVDEKHRRAGSLVCA